MSFSWPTQNFVTLTLTSHISEHTLILTLACFFFLLQPVFLTLTVTCIFSALASLVYVAALQSGHTAFSIFLFWHGIMKCKNLIFKWYTSKSESRFVFWQWGFAAEDILQGSKSEYARNRAGMLSVYPSVKLWYVYCSGVASVIFVVYMFYNTTDK